MEMLMVSIGSQVVRMQTTNTLSSRPDCASTNIGHGYRRAGPRLPRQCLVSKPFDIPAAGLPWIQQYDIDLHLHRQQLLEKSDEL
jgi:hypothetical protein